MALRNSIYNATESISYLLPEFWDLVPNNLKKN